MFALADYSGKYVLLDFWGTWCKPCVQLVPELKKLNATFKHSNFQLVGIAYDRNLDQVKDFVEKNEMDWVHLFVDMSQRDHNSVVEIFKVNAFPTKILIDPSGRILARGKSIEEITTILKEKTNPF